MPPDGMDDAEFLDSLVERGHTAYELAFVKGFPWKEQRCEQFAVAAAERDIALSLHAPYFAILTSEEKDTAKQTRAALEHSMKLGKALGARVIVAHTGYTTGRTAEELHQVAAEGLAEIEPKVRHLGVALGLEVGGKESSFGTLGDIALMAERFSFIHPVVDWAHVHAMSGGALTTREAFASVFHFLRDSFPGWTIDPLHCQFTDNQFGKSGEIRHVPYGEGSLRVGPMVEAALEMGMRLTVISEAHEQSSHDAIKAEIDETIARARPAPSGEGRPLGSGAVAFPTEVRVAASQDAHFPIGTGRPVRISNIDKQFFPDGYTKGDLIQYYASVAPTLLPHLRDRAIVMARFPDGAEGDFFYEKRAPGHTPGWLPTVPMWSEHRDDHIDYITTPDAESLMWLANMGAIEIHPWLSRVAAPDRPDFAVFDLDPAEGASWEQVVTLAGLVRVALERLGLEGHIKTSGATGLHIYVPIDPLYPYERVRRFVETVGRFLVAADPDLATMEWDIPKRKGKVFVDHNQNVAGKTIASVYSVRPRAGAPVSTPLLWEEMDAIDPTEFTIATIWNRLAKHGDLFAPVLRGGQTLEQAEEGLGL